MEKEEVYSYINELAEKYKNVTTEEIELMIDQMQAFNSNIMAGNLAIDQHLTNVRASQNFIYLMLKIQAKKSPTIAINTLNATVSQLQQALNQLQLKVEQHISNHNTSVLTADQEARLSMVGRSFNLAEISIDSGLDYTKRDYTGSALIDFNGTSSPVLETFSVKAWVQPTYTNINGVSTNIGIAVCVETDGRSVASCVLNNEYDRHLVFVERFANGKNNYTHLFRFMNPPNTEALAKERTANMKVILLDKSK